MDTKICRCSGPLGKMEWYLHIICEHPPVYFCILGRLIRSPGVPEERGVWGSRGGDRSGILKEEEKGQTSFFSFAFLSLSHIKVFFL